MFNQSDITSRVHFRANPGVHFQRNMCVHWCCAGVCMKGVAAIVWDIVNITKYDLTVLDSCYILYSLCLDIVMLVSPCPHWWYFWEMLWLLRLERVMHASHVSCWKILDLLCCVNNMCLKSLKCLNVCLLFPWKNIYMNSPWSTVQRKVKQYEALQSVNCWLPSHHRAGTSLDISCAIYTKFGCMARSPHASVHEHLVRLCRAYNIIVIVMCFSACITHLWSHVTKFKWRWGQNLSHSMSCHTTSENASTI